MSMIIDNTYKDIFTQILEIVKGGYISRVLIDKDSLEEDEKYYGLQIFKKVDGRLKVYNLWFLRDEEGNGPGSFQIDEQKIKEE